MTVIGALKVLAAPINVTQQDSTPVRFRVVLTTLSLALQGMVRLTISVLVGQQAGPSALAQVATGLATASILSLLWPSATGAAAARFIAAAQSSPEENDVHRVTAHLGHRTLQASLLLAPVGATYWLLRGGPLSEAAVVALLTAGLCGYAYVRGVHNGARQNLRLVMWDLLASSLGIGATAAMLRFGHSGVVVLAPLAALYLTLTAAAWPRARRSQTANIREMDHFVLWSTLGSIASAGLLHLTMILADHQLASDGAGHFAAAINLVAPAAMLANSFSMVFYPHISVALARGEYERAITMVRKATDILILVVGGTFGVVVLLAPWLVTTLWGRDFLPAASILPILTLGPLARAVSMPAVASMTSRNRSGVETTSTAAFLGLLVAMIIWGAFYTSHGWLPVAIGYSAAMIVTAARVLLQASIHDQMSLLAPFTRLAFGIAAVVVALRLRDSLGWGFLTTASVSGIALISWAFLNATALRSLARKAPR